MEKTAIDQNPMIRHSSKLNAGTVGSCGLYLDDFYRQQLARRVQRFAIHGEKEQVVSGREGVTLYIPALSFVDENSGRVAVGEITLELVELLDTKDMMLTRRPTTSNGELLETGGAFAFSARQSGQSLQLARPVTARVPVSARTTRPDLMTAFTAPLRSTRTFDWQPSNTDAVLNANRSREERSYEVEITRPQWINCDYFLRRARGRSEFTQITAEPDPALQQQHGFILYKDLNAVAMMYPTGRDGQLRFHTPKGYEATIALIATDGEDFLFGTQDIHTSNGPHFRVPLEWTAQEDIQRQVSAITGR